MRGGAKEYHGLAFLMLLTAEQLAFALPGVLREQIAPPAPVPPPKMCNAVALSGGLQSLAFCLDEFSLYGMTTVGKARTPAVPIYRLEGPGGRNYYLYYYHQFNQVSYCLMDGRSFAVTSYTLTYMLCVCLV